jgi:hypothetical protein
MFDTFLFLPAALANGTKNLPNFLNPIDNVRVGCFRKPFFPSVLCPMSCSGHRQGRCSWRNRGCLLRIAFTHNLHLANGWTANGDILDIQFVENFFERITPAIRSESNSPRLIYKDWVAFLLSTLNLQSFESTLPHASWERGRGSTPLQELINSQGA